MSWLLIPVLLYLTIMAIMFFMQRSLLYFPDKNALPLSAFPALKGDELRIKSADGTLLSSWWMPGKPTHPTVLYLHGNAGNLNNRAEKFSLFQQAGFNVLALSYRGYGHSDGSPSEAGLYSDAEAALLHLVELQKLQPDQILLYGESLGTGVATELATRHKVKGLVLEAPFTSVVNRAAELYPWLPVSFLLKDRFESIRKIPQIHVPIQIFHNHSDAVVPIHHGKALYDAAHEPKEAHWLDGPSHVEFEWQWLVQQILHFHYPEIAE